MMELEFDKEIDAILRKGRDNRCVLVGDDPPEPKKHLDADTIAAFAENALPQKAKLRYMEHFADCDRCRQMLSQSILMNNEAVAATASSVVSAPVAAAVPGYLKIFGTPNIALAMGALVLTFGGLLGYLVLQNRNDGTGASVVKVSDQQPTHTYSGSEPAANAAASNSAITTVANTAANMSAATNAPASNPVATTSGPSADAEPNAVGRSDAPSGRVIGGHDGTAATSGAAPEEAKPAVAAPPPRPVAQPLRERDEKMSDAEKTKKEVKDLPLSGRNTDDVRLAREAVPPAAKKTGPNRASGPRQNTQNDMSSQNVAGMMSPAKSVGGKTFDYRDGVWYDSAYHNQSTTNVRRGSDNYKKLDSGLRKIADSIGGTVVVVWKSKAYRIQ